MTQIYDRNAPFYDAMETPMEWMALRAWRRDLISGLSGHVLELGVGTGRNLALYPADVVLTAVDVAPSMLKRARARARQLGIDATFVQADMRDLPFETASFDAVVTSCVFCSVAEPRAGLAEARRVLKPGGHLRMVEHQRPDPPALGWLFDRLNPLVVRLTGANVNRETQRLVEDAGFSSVTVRRLDGLGIVRFFNACDAREPEVGTEEADAKADASDTTGAPPAGTECAPLHLLDEHRATHASRRRDAATVEPRPNWGGRPSRGASRPSASATSSANSPASAAS